MKRKVVAAVALAAVGLIQLTIVNGLALPGGGTPDLVLLCVIALAMAGGPACGLTAGFCAGLGLDLAPPASQLIGLYALVLCLVGYASGRLRFTMRHSAVLALASAAVMAALGETLVAVLTLALDTPEVTWTTVAHVLPPSVLYDIAIGPLVLLGTARLAAVLGVSFSPLDDSPALETGGSAAPVTVAGSAGMAGAGAVRRTRQRPVTGGGSRAAASGRWLVGDVADDTPAMGAIGWLAGPTRSRRARREQARLTAMLTGASPRKGASWVGRRPPGLLPLTPVVPPRAASGLARLRPGSGVAGSAAAVALPASSSQARPGRRVRLGLADEQRRRSRAASRLARGAGRGRFGIGGHGPDRHGLTGPGVPRITFRTPGVLSDRPGRADQAASPANRRVPRIAFGAAGQPGTSRPAGRPVPKIAFGGSGPGAANRANRSARPAVPRFGPGSARFAAGAWLSGSAARRGGLRLSATSGRSPGGRVAGPAGPVHFGVGHRGAGHRRGKHGGRQHGGGPRGGGRLGLPGTRSGPRPKQPRFARSTGSRHRAGWRQPKTARMSAGRGVFRRLPWIRRAGGRSAVWRIGSRRVSGYR